MRHEDVDRVVEAVMRAAGLPEIPLGKNAFASLVTDVARSDWLSWVGLWLGERQRPGKWTRTDRVVDFEGTPTAARMTRRAMGPLGGAGNARLQAEVEYPSAAVRSYTAVDVPTTTALVVGGALASRDFTPVHHDKAAAQAQGLPDVFMNILTTNGFVGRYVTDWAGPDALVRGIKTKLGGPNLPGDTLKIRGKVAEAKDGRVAIQVTGNNSWGNDVSATLTVELPRK